MAAYLVSACGGPVATPTIRPPASPTATASLGAAVAAAEARLSASLARVGLSLQPWSAPYRPGEPAALQDVPRAVYRVTLADPDTGWVVIYDPGAGRDVDRLARDMAAYLASGLGQTNYPRDAEFAVNEVEGALVFSWWSRERSPEPGRAQAAFDAIRAVGRPYEVRR